MTVNELSNVDAGGNGKHEVGDTELGDVSTDQRERERDVRRFCQMLLGHVGFDRVSEPDNFEANLKSMDSALMTNLARFMISAEMCSQSKINDRIKDRIYQVFKFPGLAKEVKTPWQMQAYFVFAPCVMFFCAFVFQSFMLHIATAMYVYYMDNGHESMRTGGGQLLDLVGNYVGESTNENTQRVNGIATGAVKIPLVLLDISGALPLVLCFLTNAFCFYATREFNIKLWNKTLLVASFMAISKGTWDAMTVLPDSIGWESCKERLGETGLKQMREMQFISGSFLAEVWEAMFFEIASLTGSRVRYCADMMISGHTYFAALFSLSAWHQMAFLLDYVRDERYRCKLAMKVATCVVCVLCLTTEIILVALARFHYTVDMVASVVLVLLLWDSTYVEGFARDWSACWHYWDLEALKRSAPILACVVSRIRRQAPGEPAPEAAEM